MSAGLWLIENEQGVQCLGISPTDTPYKVELGGWRRVLVWDCGAWESGIELGILSQAAHCIICNVKLPSTYFRMFSESGPVAASDWTIGSHVG